MFKGKLEYNFLIYLIGKIISAGLTVLAIPVFLRIFGVEVYGKFIIFYTSFLMIMAGGSGWVNQGILRFYTLEHNKKFIEIEIDEMILSSFLVFSALLIGVFFVFDAGFTLTVIGVLSLLFSMIFSTRLSVAQILFKSKKFVITDIIRAVSFFITPIVCYKLFGIDPLLCLFLGVFFSYVFGLIYISKLDFYIPKLNFNKGRWKMIFFKYGLPLTVWVVFSPTTNGVDRYVIEYSLGAVLLAQYTAVFDIIFKLFSNLSIPFNNIVQPLLINSYNNKDFKTYKETMTKSIIYLTVIFIIFIAFTFLLKRFLICDFLGFSENYEDLSSLLMPLIVASYIWQLSVLFQKNLEVSNKTFEMAVYMLIIVLIIVCFGLYYVPIYGLIASAYICLISAFIYLLLVFYGTFKHFKI